MGVVNKKNAIDEKIRKRPRNAEFRLGCLGSVLGFFMALLFFWAVGGYIIYGHGDGRMSSLGVGAATLSALVASVVAWKTVPRIEYHPKSSGWILIVCGLVESGSILFYEAPSSVLLLIAGLMCLLRSDTVRH